MKINTFITIVVLMAFLSCSKDEVFTVQEIENYASTVPVEAKDLVQLRLAFGKNVALALDSKIFRDYIYDLTDNPQNQLFEELVFDVHKDDVLENGETVSELLNRYQDEEIKALFADELLSKVILEDPLVTIKIPNMFYGVDDLKSFIPSVYVKPHSFLLEGNGNRAAMFYKNGYSELVPIFGSIINGPEYFYFSVNYSENFFLLNKTSLLNEKGIPLYELLPQVESCWESIKSEVYSQGVVQSLNPNNIYINRHKLFNLWKEKCTYQGEFISDNESCDLPCKRDCDPNHPKIMVMEYLVIKEALFYVFPGIQFNEISLFSYNFASKISGRVKRVVVPVQNITKMRNNINVSITNKEKETSSGSSFSIPSLNYVYDEQVTQDTFYLNAIIDDDFDINNAYASSEMGLYYYDNVMPVDLFICSNIINESVYPSFINGMSCSSNFSIDYCRANATLSDPNKLIKLNY